MQGLAASSPICTIPRVSLILARALPFKQVFASCQPLVFLRLAKGAISEQCSDRVFSCLVLARCLDVVRVQIELVRIIHLLDIDLSGAPLSFP